MCLPANGKCSRKGKKPGCLPECLTEYMEVDPAACSYKNPINRQSMFNAAQEISSILGNK
jgi:hypothetical protein